MQTLSEQNKKILMVAINRLIEEKSDKITQDILNKNISITYPPNGGLNDEESLALSKLKDISNIESALRKVFAENSSAVVFDFLNFIDGTGDPYADWSGVELVDSFSEGKASLHDEFYNAYWEWCKIRPEKNWKLDSYQGQF